MGAGGLGYEGERVGCFVQASEFAQATEGEEARGGVRERDEAEGVPEVFAETGGNGFLAEEGELGEGGGVLWDKGQYWWE